MTIPLFQHRHYVWIAEFAATYLDESQKTELANQLCSTNPNFDRDRFLRAAHGRPGGRDRR